MTRETKPLPPPVDLGYGVYHSNINLTITGRKKPAFRGRACGISQLHMCTDHIQVPLELWGRGVMLMNWRRDFKKLDESGRLGHVPF